MPNTAANRLGIRRTMVAAILLSIGLSARPLSAQTTNPNVVEFIPPAEHDALLSTGQPVISRYDLAFYQAGAIDSFMVVNLGKPARQADGLARVSLDTVFAAWPLPGVTSEARIFAVGPNGTGVSTASNTFVYTDSTAKSSASAVTAPYGGTAVALPGRIQVENYDLGGSGVAYADTTSGNTGGVYRTDAVDIQKTSDSGGGYNIGWMRATEWLKYSVNVAAAGTYAIDVRVASGGSGGTFHIEVNGINKTGPITIPNTGGWQTWTTVTKTNVSLAAGQQVLRIVMDANGATGGVGNINWIAVR